MKRYFLLSILVPLVGWSQQHAPAPMVVRQLVQTDSQIDSTLKKDEAIFIFQFTGIQKQDSIIPVRYQLGKVAYDDKIVNHQLRVKTTPGIQTFALNMLGRDSSIGYSNISAVPLEAKAQTVTTFSATVLSYISDPSIETIIIDTSIRIQQTLCKPVIYLYPKEITEVSVVLNIKGTKPIYYPDYTNSWEVTARPNGDLNFHDDTFRYLFWESTEEDHLTEIDVNEGFVVAGSESSVFLEEKLKAFGLTSEERADFTTYWAPKMMLNPKNLVRFEWNETCDKFAELSISPKPDHVYRLYVFIAPIDSDIELKPQEIPKIDRSGFVVIEWGGQISDYQPKTSL